MKRKPIRWHIITGEYPPHLGGVSDYTRQLARALAAAGDAVCVWAPEIAGDAPLDPGVEVRHLPGRFGPRALWKLSAILKQESKPFRILIQYLPQLYGYRGMNLLFCLWIFSIRRLRPWVMFHEVAVSPSWRHRWSTNLLGFITHAMAGIIAASADRCFVSIPRWTDMLRRVGLRHPRPTWLPISSTVEIQPQPVESAAIRSRLAAGSDSIVLGHFGTFGVLITVFLAPLLTLLLDRHPDWSILLIGRNSKEFAAQFCRDSPMLAKQVIAVSDLSPADIAAHLGACDLLVQPYSDGVSSRRTSLLAGLALGLPIVSNEGISTEPLWREHQLVAIAEAGDAGLEVAVERLAAQPMERRLLGERGLVGYEAYFSMKRTIQILRE